MPRKNNVALVTRLYLMIAVTALASAANAAESSDATTTAKPEFKLTPSYYKSSDGNDSVDINLRGVFGQHTAWLGQYHDKEGFSQTRTGYEFRQDAGSVRIVWSGQLASQGFIGASISSEIGGDTYGIVGWGRTNLHDYYNLNFDPNDAITIGIGTRALPQTELSLFCTSDDRLHTHQRNTHFVWRYRLSAADRVTLDASYKSGLNSDTVFVHGYGISVTYDFHQYFVRVARDQYANFTANQLTRYSLGLRF